MSMAQNSVFSLAVFLFALFWACPGPAAEPLPYLPPEVILKQGLPAGKGFRTRFLDREINVPPLDRRSLNAWELGSTINFPAPSGRPLEPFGAIYLWRRPDKERLFHADIALVYNNLFFAKAFAKNSPFEWVTTFENYTLPRLEQAELIEGRDDEDSKVEWGYARPGFGVGYRRQVSPFHQDNMAALDFIVEPGLLYFGRHNKGSGFIKPEDTFELRTRLQFRWDALSRDLLFLADEGFAMGADGVWGYRDHWNDWGLDGREKGHNTYTLGSAYALIATPLPWGGKRHHLIASVHGGIGHHLDRFNRTVTQRLGGGINPLGQEFHSTAYPVLPGAAYLEFFPDHYVIGYGEYRFATTFFSNLHLYGGGAYLNPQKVKRGNVQRDDTVMPFVGARISTGLPGKMLLVVDYAHNFGLKRKQTGSGNQVTIWLSGMF